VPKLIVCHNLNIFDKLYVISKFPKNVFITWPTMGLFNDVTMCVGKKINLKRFFFTHTHNEVLKINLKRFELSFNIYVDKKKLIWANFKFSTSVDKKRTVPKILQQTRIHSLSLSRFCLANKIKKIRKW
jgi:hypothetical protein